MLYILLVYTCSWSFSPSPFAPPSPCASTLPYPPFLCPPSLFSPPITCCPPSVFLSHNLPSSVLPPFFLCPPSLFPLSFLPFSSLLPPLFLCSLTPSPASLSPYPASLSPSPFPIRTAAEGVGRRWSGEVGGASSGWGSAPSCLADPFTSLATSRSFSPATIFSRDETEKKGEGKNKRKGRNS